MERIKKMREKKGKKLLETFVSNKIKEMANKLEKNLQRRESLNANNGLNPTITYDNGLFNILNQKVSKIHKKKPKKKQFTD